MKRAFAVAALAAVVAPCLAYAAPKQLKVVETITINAPADKVWATVKDFDSLDKWHPAIAKDEIVMGTNNKPGAVRALSIKDGPVIKEKLLSFSNATHSFTYKFVDTPFPIKDYVSTLHVKANKDGTTLVRWSSTFKRKNPADNPPDAESDAAGVKLITGVYQGGLANLKKQLEGG
ncbi:MAG TPA: SRPBCC family protein [Steroidobacteraceae bacterium]|jgi:mxaD protein|nr:SRPBCC family protein [Steroidobacteraceae bacterium]